MLAAWKWPASFALPGRPKAAVSTWVVVTDAARDALSRWGRRCR